MRSILLWVSENDWCRNSLPSYGFVKRAVKRFMPGEGLDDALDEAARLQGDSGIPTLITFLGENVADADEAKAVADHYLDALEAVTSRGLDCELSVKPTHLGLDLGQDVVHDNLLRLTEAAAAKNNWVWLDMEYSRYVDPTLELYRSILSRHKNFGLCLQSYLRRTPDDLESLIPLGPAIRLVKGAYAEPAELAYPEKSDVDQAFFDLSIRMLAPDARASGTRVGLGTHDGKLIKRPIVVAGDLPAPAPHRDDGRRGDGLHPADVRTARHGRHGGCSTPTPVARPPGFRRSVRGHTPQSRAHRLWPSTGRCGTTARGGRRCSPRTRSRSAAPASGRVQVGRRRPGSALARSA